MIAIHVHQRYTNETNIFISYQEDEYEAFNEWAMHEGEDSEEFRYNEDTVQYANSELVVYFSYINSFTQLC